MSCDYINSFLDPGTVERQAAHFFRITVTEADLKVEKMFLLNKRGISSSFSVDFNSLIKINLKVEKMFKKVFRSI